MEYIRTKYFISKLFQSKNKENGKINMQNVGNVKAH